MSNAGRSGSPQTPEGCQSRELLTGTEAGAISAQLDGSAAKGGSQTRRLTSAFNNDDPVVTEYEEHHWVRALQYQKKSPGAHMPLFLKS